MGIAKTTYLSSQSQVTLKKRNRRRDKNDSCKQFNRRWNTDENTRRTSMLPTLTSGSQQPSIHLAVLNIFLSLTAILGNSLILVALRKESSLHPPSKLLYRSLVTTDLLVGLVTHPLSVTYRISSIYKQWNLCRYARSACYLSSYALCGVSLTTMTTISVDRLLALLLGLRYKRIVTLKRTYIIVAAVWVSSGVAALCYILNKRMVFWFLYIIVPLCLVI